MVFSKDPEKAFDKIQHPLTIEVLNKTSVEGKYLNIIQATYDKPSANIILTDEKLKAFPVKSGVRQGCPLLPLPFNLLLEVLARAIRQEKEIKGIQITGMKKCHFFADDMVLYTETLKIPPKTIGNNKQTQSSCRIQNQRTKIHCILYTNNEISEKEMKKTKQFLLQLQQRE